MKYGSISKIFFGLLLMFFNINICHLNLLTSFLGSLLVATATWQLRQVNKHLKNAFLFSIVQLIFQTSGFMLFCSQMSNINIPLAGAVIGMLCMIALIYNLFSGLAKMAQAQGHDDLSKKLSRCYVLYTISAIIIAAALLIPPLAFIAIPIVAIVFIYILVQVNRLNKAIDNSQNTFEEHRLNVRYSAMLGAYLGLTVLLCFSVLIYYNCPNVNTEIYEKNDCAEQIDIQSIKNNMLTLGFEQAILDDLPDSEVANYQDVLSIQNKTYNQQTDGGMLEITKCVSTYKDGKIRLLIYYKWLTIPKHQYCDRLSVMFPQDLIISPNNTNFNGFGLYDKKSKDGTITYKADFISEERLSSISNSRNFEINYRVFGNELTKQRAFFAYDVLVTRPSLELCYNTIINYSHQRSIFNFNNANEVNANQQQITFNDLNGFAYDKFQFLFEDDYKPVT